MKSEIFKTFHELCPDRTIFTTNTSTLIPSMFAEDTGRPDKFLAFHFHDILKTDVVDIMPHPGTSESTIIIVKAFAESLGQIVILLKKENHGYVFNAMISALLRSALTLAANNVASIEDIDRAWMGVCIRHWVHLVLWIQWALIRYGKSVITTLKYQTINNCLILQHI